MLSQNSDTTIFTLQHKFETYYQLAKNISDISNSLNENLFKILAGSIVLLFGSDFLSPVNIKFRISYLLFIPSWISMGISFYYSNAINRISASLPTLNKLDYVKSIIYDSEGLSSNYASQSFYFSLSIAFIFIWLIFYLYWWVFHGDKVSKSKK